MVKNPLVQMRNQVSLSVNDFGVKMLFDVILIKYQGTEVIDFSVIKRAETDFGFYVKFN